MARLRPPLDPKFLQALRLQTGKEMGAEIGLACSGIDGDPQALFPEELDGIRKAIPRRQREFAAGRQAAREAMANIGWPPMAIPSAPDRSPVWPPGLVGSISHNRVACVAIAGRHHQVHALGIDLEDDVPIEPTLWNTICRPEELAVLASIPGSQQGRWVTRVFCAKEAFYKWQFPQTGHMLSFCDVHVTLHSNNHNFRARTMKTGSSMEPSPSLEGRGHLLSSGGLLLACLGGTPFPAI